MTAEEILQEIAKSYRDQGLTNVYVAFLTDPNQSDTKHVLGDLKRRLALEARDAVAPGPRFLGKVQELLSRAEAIAKDLGSGGAHRLVLGTRGWMLERDSVTNGKTRLLGGAPLSDPLVTISEYLDRIDPALRLTRLREEAMEALGHLGNGCVNPAIRWTALADTVRTYIAELERRQEPKT